MDSLYATPRHPRKWVFHPRKRPVVMPLISIVAAGWMIFEMMSRF